MKMASLRFARVCRVAALVTLVSGSVDLPAVAGSQNGDAAGSWQPPHSGPKSVDPGPRGSLAIHAEIVRLAVPTDTGGPHSSGLGRSANV